MSPNTRLINSKCHSEFTNFILEKFSQRLNQLQLHGCREASHIMMSLNGCRWSLVRNTLNHIGIQGSLQKVVTLSTLGLDLLGLLLKDINESTSNNLPLLLRIGNPLQQSQEPIFGIHTPQIHPAIISHPLQNLRCLVLPQATIVYQNSMKPIPDSSGHENRRNSRINTSAHGTDDVSSGSHLRAHLFDEFVGVICHDPILFGFGDFDHKVFEDVASERRMGYLGMELKTPHFGFKIFDGDEIGVGCSSNAFESLRNFMEFVTV
mmetsp:Transcript_2275/g.5324  ORF Transcript_2275/g.5324 Transcript_2275/m.5324 type:complete len:264 (+) Transcript_2275:2572-3363(+)